MKSRIFLFGLTLFISHQASAQTEGTRLAWGQLIAVNGTHLTPAQLKGNGGRFIALKGASPSDGFDTIEFSWMADKALIAYEKIYDQPISLLGQERTARGTQSVIEAEDGHILLFTPPGPQVAKIPAVKIKEDPQQIHIQVTETTVVVPEDKIDAVKAKLKALGFKGDDNALDAFVKERATRKTTRAETWVIRSVELAEGVNLEALLSPANASSPKNAVLNITKAWATCIGKILEMAQRAAEITNEPTLDPEQLFLRAVREVVKT